MKTIVCIVFGLACRLSVSSWAQTLLPGFAQTQVTNGITSPTAMTFDAGGRVFVTEQGGRLRVIKNGALLTAPAIQLNVNSKDERGLLGVTLDPDFSTNGYLYLYYTEPTPLHNRVSRFTLVGDVIQPGSELTVLDIDPLSSAQNHNGGAIGFGSDGKLYVAIGENAYGPNSQNLDTHLGKVLRINKDGSAPDDNPFTTGSEQKKRIWAYGLRNPFTFSFQPGTGRFFVNDVGQSTWEEIDDATARGKNFGWPTAEGMSTNVNFANPIYVYGRGTTDGLGCALTGGTFFSPSVTNYPSGFYGKYFFLDLCSQWINFIDFATTPVIRSSFAMGIAGNPVGLMTGPDGNLYYLSRTDGALYKISYTASSPPFIIKQPADTIVMEGGAIGFGIAAIGSMPLTYQWKQGGAAISGATSAEYTIDSTLMTDAGKYAIVVSNSAGSVTSNEVTLTVTPNPLLGTRDGAREAVSIYPNPGDAGSVMVIINAARDQPVSIQLVDVLSQKVRALNVHVYEGENRVQLNRADLSDGLYAVFLVVDSRPYTKRLIISGASRN